MVAACAAPLSAAEHDEQLWLAGAVRAEIAPSLDLGADGALRFGAEADGLATALARVTATYRISDAISVDGGVARFSTYRDGDEVRAEQRAFQSLIWRMGSAAGGQWTLRARLEQRMIEQADRTGWRLRPRIAYARPLSDTVRMTLSSEAFFALNDTDFGTNSGYEGQRSIISAGFAASEHVTIDVGYLNQWTVRRARPDSVTHALTTGLTYSF